MKKLFALLLAALLALDLISCSGKKPPKGTYSGGSGTSAVSDPAGTKEPDESGTSAESDPEGTKEPVDSDTSAGGDPVPAPQSSEYIEATGSLCIWEDTVYYIDGEKIKSRGIHDTEGGGTLIYDGSVKLFSNMRRVSVLIDRVATAENNNSPVLLLAVSSYSVSARGLTGKIVSFNTKTRKWDTVKDNIPGMITNFAVYGDMLFYNAMDISGGDDTVNKIARDGSGHESVRPDASATLTIGSVHGDAVYINGLYVNEFALGERKLYRCTTDFKERERIFDALEDGIRVLEVVRVTDDEIYCTCTNDALDGAIGLYRFDADDLTKANVVLEKADSGRAFGGMYFYVPDPNVNVLYAYDLGTGESKMMYDASDIEAEVSIDVYGYTDKYVICCIKEFEIEIDEDGEYDYEMIEHYVCVDISSGESWELPI